MENIKNVFQENKIALRTLLFLITGAVLLFSGGLQTVCGKYLHQESRIDVIHTSQSYNASGFSADADEELAGEIAPVMSAENKKGLFSDGSQWDLQEDLEEAEFFAGNAAEDADLCESNLIETYE